jgi:hypothetical protein
MELATNVVSDRAVARHQIAANLTSRCHPMIDGWLCVTAFDMVDFL